MLQNIKNEAGDVRDGKRLHFESWYGSISKRTHDGKFRHHLLHF
jgi:hypothetical protein